MSSTWLEVIALGLVAVSGLVAHLAGTVDLLHVGPELVHLDGHGGMERCRIGQCLVGAIEYEENVKVHEGH